MWIDEHGAEPATVTIGDNIYATTVQGAIASIGGLPFTHCRVSMPDGIPGHFFTLTAN